MLNSKFVYLILTLFVSFSLSCSNGKSAACPELKSKGYCIFPLKGPENKKWAEYLYEDLHKRTGKQCEIVYLEEKTGCNQVHIGLDKELETDYCIKNDKARIILKAKDESTMVWLVNQYIKKLSEQDDRFESDDLPPGILTFEDKCADFAFSYREPFFYPNLENEFSKIMSTNSIERDWGIWGHNLHKILKDKESESIYAKQGPWIEKDQYCFSNDETYNLIKEYIIDHFGNGESYSQRFMIMPNDNKIVCTCDLCKKRGNSENDATPALSYIIKRLAKQFPYHTFITSAYLTVKNPPKEKWADNTGVMISTIDVPKGVGLDNNQKAEALIKTISQWQNCTPNIYLWDYASNFDDYMTPFPILYGLKKQLSFYKDKGINGIFLNASGYDYSSFEDVKTFVASALMMDTDLSVDSLCRSYFNQFYPVTHELLCDYYLSLEKRIDKKNKPLNIYGGFRETLQTYLNKDEFVDFYNNLLTIKDRVSKEESVKLEKLLIALSFTRLQLAHTQGKEKYGFAELKGKELHLNNRIIPVYERLKNYNKYENLVTYKESGGGMDAYLSNWNDLFNQLPYKNILINETVRVLSNLDKDYQNIELLNDGVPGFSSDYHQGWLIVSNDLYLQIDTDNLKETKKMKLRFLSDEKHSILPPEKIEIYKDNIDKYIEMTSEHFLSGTGVRTAVMDVDFSDCKQITLKIYKKKYPGYTMACDEIQLN